MPNSGIIVLNIVRLRSIGEIFHENKLLKAWKCSLMQLSVIN